MAVGSHDVHEASNAIYALRSIELDLRARSRMSRSETGIRATLTPEIASTMYPAARRTKVAPGCSAIKANSFALPVFEFQSPTAIVTARAKSSEDAPPARADGEI